MVSTQSDFGKFPHVKVALVMRAYSEEPRSGICPCPEVAWAKLKECRMEHFNDLLGYFRNQVEVRAAAAMTADQSAIIISRMILAATGAFFHVAVRVTGQKAFADIASPCLLYTSPSPRDS